MPDDNSLESQSKIRKNLENYSLLSRDLSSLIENELFADVFFEVEGKIIPAHRNILCIRSEYFRAMIGKSSNFKENIENHSSPCNPIYIPDIRYDEFTQILSFLYTGHIEVEHLPYDITIGLMKLADSMNIVELEQLALFQLSNIINQDNCVKIFKEAYETSPDVLKNVISLCYDNISKYFSYVSRSEDFVSLSQDLMLKIIENVVPKLSRLDSAIINNNNNNNNNNNAANYQNVTDDLVERLLDADISGQEEEEDD